MKTFTPFLLAIAASLTSASAASIATAHLQARQRQQQGTVVLFEVQGIPGNECLTFRNNGEIVDAACVNTAADRQITPTTIGGTSALRVQRTFSNGFRPDLVNTQACLGFNGTHFRAEACNTFGSGIEAVTFNNKGELVTSSGACANGHDSKAQITVDVQGDGCAVFKATKVSPAQS